MYKPYFKGYIVFFSEAFTYLGRCGILLKFIFPFKFSLNLSNRFERFSSSSFND